MDSTVVIHYELRVGDILVESTFDGEPETVVIGSGELPRALEIQIEDMMMGETRSFCVPAAEGAFGQHYPDRVVKLERSAFAELPAGTGSLIDFQLPSGEPVAGVVVDMDEAVVTVDFNNPLVGRDVTCRIELIKSGNLG